MPQNDYLGVSGAVVQKLIQPYLRKGHVPYTDGWYMSPDLCKYIHNHDTGLMRTVTPRNKNMA